MTTITMTIEEYKKIRQLKYFAGWYISELPLEPSTIEQWEEDRDEVLRGIAVLDAIDINISARRVE